MGRRCLVKCRTRMARLSPKTSGTTSLPPIASEPPKPSLAIRSTFIASSSWLILMLLPTLKQDWLAGGSIFVFTLLVFWFSPVHQLTDSNYSMLLSESLLRHRSFALDNYNIPRLTPRYHDNTFKNGEMYQLELVDPHLYYYFPPGSSVLSLPYVALMNAFGVSAAKPDGTYNP